MICLNETENLGNLCQSNEIYKVKKKRTFNVRHQSDTQTCSIYSACELGDGSIIIADYNNNKLKRIDSKFTNRDVCELPESPFQICTINTNDVAAIHNNGKTIYFVSFAKESRRTKEINIDHGSYGIAYALSNLYLADSHTTVFVYDMNGTKLKQFTNDQTGKPLFDSIYSMTVSIDGSRIYVADDTFGIVALKEDGTLQGKYNCGEFSYVRRVCMAENGNILACGDGNNCILQFTKDGEKLGNVLSSDDTKVGCSSILYHHQMNALVVGRRDDNIDIYELI
jgi:sugar lactone lactonase YvrE